MALMFEWDGRSKVVYVDGAPLVVTDVGILYRDDAEVPVEWAREETLPDGVPVPPGMLQGWVAVVPLGENGAVLTMHVEGDPETPLEATGAVLWVELGPDPYAIAKPECTLRAVGGIEALVQCDWLADGEMWRYMHEFGDRSSWTVSSRAELMGVMSRLAPLQVVRWAA